jgi:hypothetical protein
MESLRGPRTAEHAGHDHRDDRLHDQLRAQHAHGGDCRAHALSLPVSQVSVMDSVPAQGAAALEPGSEHRQQQGPALPTPDFAVPYAAPKPGHRGRSPRSVHAETRLGHGRTGQSRRAGG